MSDLIQQSIISNIWCDPDQNKQFIIKPSRLTPSSGVIGIFNLSLLQITMPNLSDVFHIFNIGQLHPSVLNLFYLSNRFLSSDWYLLGDVMNDSSMYIDIYTTNGVEIPRQQTYYYFDYNKDLIIAIKENSDVPISYGTDDIYLRFYSNSYFNSDNNNVIVNTKINASTQDIQNIQTLYQSLVNQTGYVLIFVNGLLVNDFNSSTIKVGSTIELVYDRSIYKVIDFSLSGLPEFLSTFYNENRYLLHYSGNRANSIDYSGDIDLYIQVSYNNSRYGVFYHRNTIDSCRNITHQDYSISVDRVSNFLVGLETLLGLQNIPTTSVFIRLFVRTTANNGRPLQYENNRINTLYLMNDTQIVNTMVSTVAGPLNWRVETLEASQYITAMNIDYRQITDSLGVQLYGYNALSVLLGNTPLQTTLLLGLAQVDLPLGLQNNSTIYEYGVNDLLIGVYTHQVGVTYTCVNSNTKLIEGVIGIGSNTPTVLFGTNNITLPVNCGYRVYKCHYILDNNNNPTSVLDNVWTDITNNNSNYTVTNNTLNWVGSDTNRFLMIRTDNSFLDLDFMVTPSQGVLSFNLTENENRGNGVNSYSLPVPLGQLDVFLNSKSLIENIDYYVNFPTVVIVNTKYLTASPNTTQQHIHIRFTGFCNSSLQYEPPNDIGFIQYGALSNNNHYDLRNDKVLRILVDGNLQQLSNLTFIETTPTLQFNSSLNGLPYMVRDLVVPMETFINQDTYSFRALSQTIDVNTSNYLTTIFPQELENNPSVITTKYNVYSPFIYNIVNFILLNQITDNEISSLLSDSDVINFCHQFEYLLTFDPTHKSLNTFSQFLNILPVNNTSSVVSLSNLQYTFLNNVVRLYCNNLLTLSPYIINAG